MSKSGTVKFFNEQKGFGFITMDGSSEDIFVHISNIENKKPLREKQSVVFDTEEGKKGTHAVNVKTI